MKFRNIYILCKQNVSAIQDIIYYQEDITKNEIKSKIDQKNTYNDINKVYVICHLEEALEAIRRLKKVECIYTVASKFLETIPYYTKGSLQLDEYEFKEFSSAKEELLSSINCIINLYEMMGLEEKKIIGLDIKLPMTNDFSDFKKNIEDLEFIFTKCPFFQHESESLEFKNIDVGSTWLTFAIIGMSVITGSILLNNIVAFIDKCMIIRSHHKTIQKQKFDLEKDEVYADDRETIIKYLNYTYKKIMDTAIKELEESTNHELADGDERGRAEQAFERLEKLLDKGIQIYSTIDSPEETKALFEPLEMKYLEIDNQLKLLDKKDDEQNND